VCRLALKVKKINWLNNTEIHQSKRYNHLYWNQYRKYVSNLL